MSSQLQSAPISLVGVVYVNNPRSNIFCFSDINECVSLDKPCGRNAICENAAPGYNCVCPQGYIARPDAAIACEQVSRYSILVLIPRLKLSHATDKTYLTSRIILPTDCPLASWGYLFRRRL